MFNNYSSILTNVALVKQNYYRTNYLTDFGRAEYMPYGFQFSITGGYTWAEFMQKPYLGFGLVMTKHFDKVGYFFMDLGIGSHFLDKLEQGAIDINLSYLSFAYKKNRYRYRLFTKVSYTTGINRMTNDLLYLGEDYGFMGMNAKAWYGQQRLFFETDFIAYTPWYIFGFRFAMIGFGSLGMLGSDSYTIMHNQVLSSVGVGVYMKNDFLAFNSFQVRVAYFPITPDGISNIGISFSTIGLIKQISLLGTKPQVVDYQ